MTDLVIHIQQLLYRHECVTVPNLGAFITANNVASVHFIDKQITPPNKKISFNRSVADNDGMLTQHISQQEKITYDQAALIVKQWVALLHSRLHQKEIIELNEIGSLRLDVENNIQFKPSEQKNYLLHSYGLPPLAIQPIIRDHQRVAVITEFVNQQPNAVHEVLNTIPHAEFKRKKKNFWGIAAVSLAVLSIIAGSLWFTVSTVNTMAWVQKDSLFSMFDFNAAFTSATSFISSVNKKNEITVPIKATPLAGSTVLPVVSFATNEYKLPHHYTYYLQNPASEYYLIFDESTDKDEAEKLKLKYRLNGIDTRILQKDSTYQVAFYYFKTKAEIDSLKQYYEDSVQLHVVVLATSVY